MRDNRVTTLHFSPFAAPQMISEALYLAERDQPFSPLFNSISRTNFCLLLSLRAWQKEQVLRLFVMPLRPHPPISSYLVIVRLGRCLLMAKKKNLQIKKPCTNLTAAPETGWPGRARVKLGKGVRLEEGRWMCTWRVPHPEPTCTSPAHQIHSHVSY